MFVGISPEMALLHCKLQSPTSFVVEYRTPALPVAPATPSQSTVIEIPFEPQQNSLERIDITMHTVPTYPAFRMPNDINTWFSEALGYEVILAYMGDVLGVKRQDEKTQEWDHYMTTRIPSKLGSVNFSDGGAILVVSEASLEDLHPRLEGERALMEKFRPNIVVDGILPWDEDFWGELSIIRPGVKIILTSNCARCMSINVDLEKGCMGEGASGNLLKKMMRDRRIDRGNKWTPIFGRYGFPVNRGEIAVGDEIAISVRNEDHTVWSKF
jgi:uncharacterized protein YcbX